MTWQEYQKQIADLFRRVPNARVEENANVMGKSGTERKLDAQIFLPMEVELTKEIKVSVEINIIVDAKLHDAPVEIGYVDRVNGQRDDVGAHVAIIASQCGFTSGAEGRAKQVSVFTMRLPSDLLGLLKEAKIPWGQVCSNVFCPSHQGHIFNWREARGERGTRLGKCDYCAMPHVLCPECCSVFGVHDYELGNPLKCPGCRSVYCVTEDHRSGEPEVEARNELDVMLLTAAHEKSSKRLTKREVERIIGGTRWQYFIPDHPTIHLTEDFLMEWSDDGEYLLLTDSGQDEVNAILAAEEASAQ